MNIYTFIKNDHKKVDLLFEQVLNATNNSLRQRFQNEIINEVMIHAASEENTLYKLLKKHVESKQAVDHGTKEHREIEEAIDHLIKEEIGTTSWLNAIKNLKKVINHHVEEEEGELFSRAKLVLTVEKSIELAIQMDELKKELSAKLIETKTD